MKRKKYGLILALILILSFFGIGLFILFPKLKNDGIQEVNSEKERSNQSANSFKIINLKTIVSAKNYMAPVFSPDGKKLAVSTLNLKGIIVNDLTDNSLKILTEDEGAGFRFSWSPDSKKIVYLARKFENGKTENTIKLVDVDNGRIFELTKGGVGASLPSFTQENEIIYSYKGTLIKQKMESLDAEEVVLENVPANIVIQTVSGEKLIIEDDEGIKTIDKNGLNRKTIVKNGAKDFAGNVKCSLDSRKILFSNNIGTEDHLFVYDFENEKTTDLGEGFSGQWMPDGRIVYCLIKNNGLVNTASELYIINSDGTGKLKITDTTDQIEVQPSISPDGKSIVYLDEKSGKIFFGDLKETNDNSFQ